MTIVNINGNDLAFENLYAVALGGAEAALTPDAHKRMEASRAVIDRLIASETAVYGVNTGFGDLAEVRISRDQILQLQLNLVRSHACGVGAPLSESETRAIMLLRANALAKGFSGVRPVVVETLCAMLKHGVHPVIPSQGSVGASGDLAPLAHLAQVVIGEGEALCSGERLSGGDALRRAGIAPLSLEAKEGLSLLNGTQGMLALASLALREAEILVDTADVATSLSLDALRGSPAAFDPRIAEARPFPGAAATARNLVRLNQGSEIRESHRAAERDPRVQDAYSLRCTPQVHGAVRDALARVRATLDVELNSATDNPLVFADGKGGGEVISGGNFHGQPLAMAADQLAVALATLGGISERRIEHMTNPHTSLLPAFLTTQPGLNSGFMIAHVTAAALASENKALAAPHSVDSIPTSGNQEDYVSMGMSAARRLRPMLGNVRHILAIELLAACQGIDLLAPLRTGALAHKAHARVRSVAKRLDEDRPLAKEIEAVGSIISDGDFQAILR
ncbi:MAG: histidine ammonia-lyase [Acidobacteria bacterium]|nr:histidine ammonia-lyase [Acidobacteriota bacterium]MBI3663140.1 histidine ammonia-lyase [Acidobacteriota bacterium]